MASLSWRYRRLLALAGGGSGWRLAGAVAANRNSYPATGSGLKLSSATLAAAAPASPHRSGVSGSGENRRRLWRRLINGGGHRGGWHRIGENSLGGSVRHLLLAAALAPGGSRG